MKTKITILALYGPQRAGKSEAAKAITVLPGWQRMSFAGPLYDMLSTLIGRDARLLDKREPAEELCGKTVRHALQTLGTEWGRDMIGGSLWLDALRRNIEAAASNGVIGVVIDDLRFFNEYRFLRELGARIVEVRRESLDAAPAGAHGSEVEWLHFTPDVVAENSGSVQEWSQTARKLVSSD
jgi:hypothetical protein